MNYREHTVRVEDYHDKVDDLIEQDEGVVDILTGKRGEKDGKRKKGKSRGSQENG